MFGRMRRHKNLLHSTAKWIPLLPRLFGRGAQREKWRAGQGTLGNPVEFEAGAAAGLSGQFCTVCRSLCSWGPRRGPYDVTAVSSVSTVSSEDVFAMEETLWWLCGVSRAWYGDGPSDLCCWKLPIPLCLLCMIHSFPDKTLQFHSPHFLSAWKSLSGKSKGRYND